MGVGVYDSVESACEACIRVTDQTEVGPDKDVYAEFYPRYQALYPALKKEFAALAALSDKYAG